MSRAPSTLKHTLHKLWLTVEPSLLTTASIHSDESAIVFDLAALPPLLRSASIVCVCERVKKIRVCMCATLVSSCQTNIGNREELVDFDVVGRANS